MLVLALLAACDCGEKSDEEILRERIDTSTVHLYAAAKNAVVEDAELGRTIMGLVSVVMGGHGPRGSTPASTADRARVATDVVGLARALLSLRETGQSIVRGERDEGPPLIPTLLGADTPSINSATDHALLFVGLWVFKMHPRSPVPLPDEILLFEASRIDADELTMPELETPVHALRSWVYATHELCDLAKRDADALEDRDRDAVRRLFSGVGGDELSADQTRATDAGMTALAHGGTAYCYFGRDEDEEAREELRAFVDAAEEAGATDADLGLVRAYLAYHADDLRETRRQLELAKTATWVDDDRREEIDELIEHLDRDETGILDRYFDKVFFAQFVARTVFRELERAGVFDAVAETEVVRKTGAFVEIAARSVGGVGRAAEDAQEAATEAAGELTMKAGALWERVAPMESSESESESDPDSE